MTGKNADQEVARSGSKHQEDQAQQLIVKIDAILKCRKTVT